MKAIDWGGKDVIDPRFLSIVRNWIETDGEVYVVVYRSRAGGSESHWIFNTYAQFVSTLNATWGICGVEVYRHPHFPLRGTVTEDFIRKALDEFEEGKDWIVIGPEEQNGHWETIGVWGDNTHQALEEELRKYLGKYVIIGPDIHWPDPPDDYPGESIVGLFDRYHRKDVIPIGDASQ
jgi:hypothetical protein